MRFPTRLVGLIVFATVIGSCDTAPGLQPENTPAPKVSDLSYTPSFIDLSQVAPQDTVGGVVAVDFNIIVTATDFDDNIVSVEYLLQSPLLGAPIIDQQELTSSGGSSFSVTSTVEIPTGAVGLYTLLVFAVDGAGNISNQVRGLFSFGSSEPFGTPPVIEAFEAFPEVVSPPATLKMVATVSDAEGLSNIREVLISTEGLSNLQMFDDGSSLGDDVAGDGKFTASFNVPAGQPADTTIFYVQAFDRNGLSSEIVSKEVRVE